MECQALVIGAPNDGSPVCGFPFLDCSGGEGTGLPAFAQLDFTKATIAYSNLGGAGPDVGANEAIRLNNVGTNTDGTSLDLIVTSRGPYVANNARLNGISGAFGQINVAIGSSVDLTLQFVRGKTNQPATLGHAMLTFYDFDKGGTNWEVLTMRNYQTYTLTADTEIIPDGTAASSTFTASVFGTGSDNPRDPRDLTPLQARRSVAFTFKGASSIDLTFSSPGSGGGGRNFLFAGKSFELPLCPSPPPPSPPPSPPPGECVPSALAADSFNFDLAYLGHTNLGGVGPDRNVPETILYKKVGTTAAGMPFDMEVRKLSPYAANNADMNRLTEGGLAEINLRGPTRAQGLRETYVDLQFCFLNGDTAGELKLGAPGEPVTLSGFQLTFFDFDQSVRPPRMPSLPRTCPHACTCTCTAMPSPACAHMHMS